MADDAVFSGFTKETVRFFTALRKNNNKEWFDRNRETYDRHVMGPAKLFVTAMGKRLKKIAPHIVAVPKVNKSIFRINRDTRFSLDPTPYKTNLGIYFWDGVRSRLESSGFYFHLEPPDLMVGGGMYIIPDNLLGRFRKAVFDAKSGAEIRKIVTAIRAIPGFSLGGEHYKRVPAGFDPAHSNAALLKHKGLYASFEAKIPAEFFSARLVDYCFERFEPLAPLHRWLMKLFG
ncbi:MAG: DUF2461 domain-containing protein [Candidatus Aminicenantes bacterium]|nr:DUF2461 domain-containing protein [Candidatus Aminicenantes bacterium]